MKKLKRKIVCLLLTLCISVLFLNTINKQVSAASNFNWVVEVGGTVMTSGTYYRNNGSGGITSSGASSSNYNAQWNSTTKTLYINNLAVTIPSSDTWFKVPIFIYESATSNLGDKQNITIDITGTNTTTGASTNTSAYFGTHIGRYGGLDTVIFQGTGSLTSKAGWCGAYVNGKTSFKGSGEYLFEAL